MNRNGLTGDDLIKADMRRTSSTNWDYEHAEVKSPVPKSRVVVSVSLSGAQFNAISMCAERLGKNISQFFREAALDRVMGAVYTYEVTPHVPTTSR